MIEALRRQRWIPFLRSSAAWCAASLGAFPTFAAAQQVPDTTYRPLVAKPEYAKEQGPVVCVDGAHLNVHTVDGQFQVFARLARADGFQVRAVDSTLARAEVLRGCQIFVIANPRNPATLRSRKRPIQEAYTAAEVAVVRTWTERGGSLLLVADHMPVVGSMKNLLEAFGFPAIDGFALALDESVARDPMVFRRADGTLRSHPITDGRSPSERVDSIASFTGAAFRTTPDLEPLWALPPATEVIIPDEPFVFPPSAPRIPGAGLLAGAAREFGRGRVMFSAEAGMFTAQVESAKREPIGMNHPWAGQNAQLVLNILHWLTARDRPR